MTQLDEQSISGADATLLLEYSEACLNAAVFGKSPDPPPEIPILAERLGVFATLRRNNRLRGCIGAFADIHPLGELLPKVVRDTALSDHRFQPVKSGELGSISLELSILGQAKTIATPEGIALGSDGVILQCDGRKSVFLPEVATEQGWDLPTMLSQLSLKAGLGDTAWQSPNAKFQTFRALKIKRDESQGGSVAVRLL